ncbi:conjugal transfer protein TrbF [Sphingomonas pruni]|uniref:conjugal transfer protein TrbF n=1 Tax=Sphingomonas pruni TaxID=40683 RepID=UPI00082BEC1E|nr:conjugal transfer protein TrbF [Sphingomonas pruni]
MIFKRAVQRYGRTPAAVTPYQRAGQLWDERIGSARVQARNWRLMAFGCLSLAAGLGGGVLWQSLQSRVVPYVVEVDRLGEARAVTEAEAAYHPTDPQIAWHLARFIRDVRGISLDPVVMKEDWLDAYAFATQRGSQFLGDYARSANPFARIGERTVTVQVTSVVRASNKSFQVKWTESAFERGSVVGRSNWTAILTIVTKTPANVEVLRKNPLGIYVDAVDWSRELDVPTSSSSPPASTPPPDRTVPTGSPLDSGLATAPTTPTSLENQQ